MEKRLHVIVSGRVQGVGFRNFVETKALALDLTGWVRNLYNGDVEVVAEGEESALIFLLADLRKGPHLAHVTDLRSEWDNPSGEFTSFLVRST